MSSLLDSSVDFDHLSDRDVVDATWSVRPQPEFVSSRSAVGGFIAGTSARQTVRIVSFSRPRWLLDAISQLGALASRSSVEGEQPLSADVVVKSLDFLRSVMRPDSAPPFIAELVDGGLQLEWHRGGIDVEVHFPRQGAAMLVYEDVGGAEEWEGHLDFGRELFVSRVVDRLSERDGEHH